MSYPFLKMLHIIGAIVFVGNIIVTGLWKAMADRTREPKVVAFGQRLVTVTDIAFTAVGAGLVLVTGFLMANAFGQEVWNLVWVRWGLALFVASGALWLAVLVPVEIGQARLARDFTAGNPIPARYWRLGRIWMWVGVLATILPLLNVYFMVFKPS